MALFRVLAGELKGTIFPLDGDSYMLGRECDGIQLLDHGISREHAELTRIGEMFLLKDLNSRNGTYVNEVAIDECVLRAGDRVQLGNTQLAFEDRYARPADSRVINFADTADRPGSVLSLKLDAGDSKETQRLRVLYEVSRILGTAKSFEDTMQRVAKTMALALRAEHVYLFAFRDNDAEPFELVAGYDENPIEELAVSRTTLARVKREGMPILSSDAMLDDRFSSAQSIVAQQIKSLLCVPLTVLNQPIGAFYATNSKLTEVFSAEDLELATIIGMVVGNSLEMWELLGRQGTLYRSVLKMLASLTERYSPDLRGRSERIANHAAAIARGMGASDERAQKMWIGGLLHDIGAVGQTEAEAQAVNSEQRKAKRAVELLEQLPEFADVAPAIVHHNERIDGSGFPDGLVGSAVPTDAQIIGLACELDRRLNPSESDDLVVTEDPAPSVRSVLMDIAELGDRRFSAKVVNALLIAYRSGRLFQEDSAIFPTGL